MCFLGLAACCSLNCGLGEHSSPRVSGLHKHWYSLVYSTYTITPTLNILSHWCIYPPYYTCFAHMHAHIYCRSACSIKDNNCRPWERSERMLLYAFFRPLYLFLSDEMPHVSSPSPQASAFSLCLVHKRTTTPPPIYSPQPILHLLPLVPIRQRTECFVGGRGEERGRGCQCCQCCNLWLSSHTEKDWWALMVLEENRKRGRHQWKERERETRWLGQYVFKTTLLH